MPRSCCTAPAPPTVPPEPSLDCPVLDRTVLTTLYHLDDGEGDILRETVDVFLISTPERIDALGGALASGDVETVERLAHMLRSSAGMLGGKRMTAACRCLERASRAGTLAEAPSLIESIGAHFAELRSALAGEMNPGPSAASREAGD